WEKMIALERSFDDEEAGRARPSRLAVARSAAQLAWTFARHEREMRRFYDGFAALRAEARREPLASLTAHELVARVRGFSTRAFRSWGATLVNDAFLILGFGVLERLARRSGLLDEHPALLTDLLCADEEIESARVVQSAVALGEEVQKDPALRAVFEANAPEDVLTELERRGHARFLEKVRAHQDSFGARGPGDLKLEEPSLRDRPAALVEIVLRYARDGVTLGSLLERERAIREAAERTLDARARGLRRLGLGALLAIVRRAIHHRERSRYCRSELFATARDFYREIGQRLTGVLGPADDVTFLSVDEVQGAVEGTGVALDLGALVALRKAEHERARSRELAAHVVSHGALAARRFEGATVASDGVLAGLGSCAGVVRGPARIVLAPEGALERARGGILVARETDPGWLYLMLAAKGLVVERGSLLSHTAIAGRKFGIPTVVGVRGALGRIVEGELIEIDGSLGTVRRIDAA
ncbi:MAG TPA: PEP-utilizing enzyme, partial [Planctomycetota bacterium]|nr:PEP-utilizing enzyme [Planctomycetota bacterium]